MLPDRIQPPPAPPRRIGICEECEATHVRLRDRPRPGDVSPRFICAVCDAKPPAARPQ